MLIWHVPGGYSASPSRRLGKYVHVCQCPPSSVIRTLGVNKPNVRDQGKSWQTAGSTAGTGDSPWRPVLKNTALLAGRTEEAWQGPWPRAARVEEGWEITRDSDLGKGEGVSTGPEVMEKNRAQAARHTSPKKATCWGVDVDWYWVQSGIGSRVWAQLN